MSNAVNAPVLVLDSSFQAISICRTRRALVLVVKDTAIIQEYADREIYPGIMQPTVIRLKEYRKIPHRVQVLTRKNILSRDGHMCMYCGESFSAMVLTLDHVIPRSKGGPSTWSNLVSCCSPCNKRKADRTPEEAGMPLLRRPRPATIHTARMILRSHGEAEKAWQPYLFFDNEGHSANVHRPS